ncbi:hypothetical protein SteCoe_34597 [Stentor coeruleus]|uniref:RING-CH-type domain-containing protein n=1 Tax=Stentor coeruleus TaxID=5963 RepID=A0A1R2AU87_9CILI|nr:hypothetical protein SteCoe_34597 [Stentor coeruleus]
MKAIDENIASTDQTQGIVYNESMQENITQSISCRICFQCDNESYIKPCRCSGSSEFVHDKCLSMWVLTKFPKIDNVKCEICLEKFEFSTKRKCFFDTNIKRLADYEKHRNIIVFCLIVLTLSIVILISLKIYFTKVNKKNVGNLVVGIICGVPILFSVFFIQLSFRKLFIAKEIILIFKPFSKKIVSLRSSIELSIIDANDN